MAYKQVRLTEPDETAVVPMLEVEHVNASKSLLIGGTTITEEVIEGPAGADGADGTVISEYPGTDLELVIPLVRTLTFTNGILTNFVAV